MTSTILEAIRLVVWNFEPDDVQFKEFDACGAMPGTPDKVLALAERVRLGLPLWHPEDRLTFDDRLE